MKNNDQAEKKDGSFKQRIVKMVIKMMAGLLRHGKIEYVKGTPGISSPNIAASKSKTNSITKQ
jgi:hypothetical protein